MGFLHGLPFVIARSEATKQSTWPGDGLLRRLRLLAMTRLGSLHRAARFPDYADQPVHGLCA